MIPYLPFFPLQPSAPGYYLVRATIVSPDYQGPAFQSTLVIGR
ncbi:MAG: hypothetical protein ABSH53_15440 [Holophaga sp.]|jgi:hypothetical protein